jgi:hypothetical protein
VIKTTKASLIAVIIIVVVIAALLLTQNYGILNINTATPSPTSIATPTASPTPQSTTPLPTPEPTVKSIVGVIIDSVGIDNATAASVMARSDTGADIIITEIILNDVSGNRLAVDDSIYQVLPADGSSVKVTINQHNVEFNLGGTFTITIVTSYGAAYTSQNASPPFY